jgi:hypothetical protein
MLYLTGHCKKLDLHQYSGWRFKSERQEIEKQRSVILGLHGHQFTGKFRTEVIVKVDKVGGLATQCRTIVHEFNG